MHTKPVYSVVVPVFNEGDSLGQLCSNLCSVLSDLDRSFELIFVDDGSNDSTQTIIEDLAKRDSRVLGIHFTRNFGKSAAYTAGFGAAHGDFIVTIDGDLQDDHKAIPILLQKLKEGFDLAVGYKSNRMETEASRKAASWLFNRALRLLFGLKIRDSNNGLRAMTREAALALQLRGDYYRFIPQLLHTQGFRVTEVPVQHHPRPHGCSKYGPSRYITGFFDLTSVRFVTAFQQKPLQFFGLISSAPFLAGAGLEIYVLICKAAGGYFRTHMAALIVGLFLIALSIIIFTIGLLGEIFAFQGRSRTYRIRSRSYKN